MLKQNRQLTSVALAITQDLVFAIQVRNQDGQLEILKSGSEPIPAGCFTDGAVTDPQQLGRTIRTLYNRMGLRERSASVVLPSGLCSLRAVRLPDLPAAERRAVVRGELEHVGAIPFHGGAFDFFWVGEASPGEAALAEAFALYTSEEVVNGIRSVLRFADLRLEALEPMSVGVLRGCALASATTGPTAVLCLDDGSTDFCILEEGEVRYLRRIPSGWNDLRAQIHAPILESPAPPAASAGTFFAAGSVPSAPAEPRGGSAPFLVTETVRSTAYFGRIRGAAPMPDQLRVPASPDDFAELHSVFAEATVPRLVAIDPKSAFGVEVHSGPVPSYSTLPAQLLGAIGTAAAGAGLTKSIPLLDIAQDDPATRVVNPWGAALPGALLGSLTWLILSIVVWGALTTNADRDATAKQLLSARSVDIFAQQAPLQLQQQLQESARGLQSTSDLPVAALLGQVAAAFAKDISINTLSVTVDGAVSMSGEGQSSEAVQRFAYTLSEGKTLREPRIDTLRQEALDRASFRIVGKVLPRTTPIKRPGGGG